MARRGALPRSAATAPCAKATPATIARKTEPFVLIAFLTELARSDGGAAPRGTGREGAAETRGVPAAPNGIACLARSPGSLNASAGRPRGARLRGLRLGIRFQRRVDPSSGVDP